MGQNHGDRIKLGARFGAVILLLLFYGLSIGTTLAKSPTIDEPVHLLRGVVLSQTGDLHLQFEHPPLSHRLIGLFLATEPSIPDVRELPSWASAERTKIAHELVWESGLDVGRIFFLARIPIALLGLLLGALAASWVLDWLGWKSMLVSLVLFSVSPNFLASSALATTDLAAAVFYFAAVYTWWRYFEYNKWLWWFLAGGCLGLALAAKLTAALLLPVLLVLAFLYWRKCRTITEILVAWLGLLPVAFLILWLIYGMELTPLKGWPFPVPVATYIQSWQNILNHVQEGHAAFFMGELSQQGWWFYFPVTFLIKTPVVTLILLVSGSIIIIRNRQLWRTGLFLLIPGAAVFTAAIFSHLNIGYRHILPLSPFLIVAAGAAVLFFQKRWLTRWLLLLGLAWALISGVHQYPHYLAYFNELVGGTNNGYRYLGDSNLDWGQDLQILADTVKGAGGRWFISYAGVGDPIYYGLDRNLLIERESGSASFPAANPQPGTYALSANHWQGLMADQDRLDWFRRYEPAATLGGSILIYHVAEQQAGSWVAHCLDPVPLLSTADADQILGQRGLRHVFFDCHDSWVFPGGGEAPGWFILPQADDWWIIDQLPPESRSRLNLVYRHKSSQFGPSYDVYYWSGKAAAELIENPENAAEDADGQPAVLPHSLNDSIALAAYKSGDSEWITEWIVSAANADPLSLQAHLVTGLESPPLVGDRLGFSSDQWMVGDRFLQRFTFAEHGSALYLETGVYNYQSLEILGHLLRLIGE